MGRISPTLTASCAAAPVATNAAAAMLIRLAKIGLSDMGRPSIVVALALPRRTSPGLLLDRISTDLGRATGGRCIDQSQPDAPMGMTAVASSSIFAGWSRRSATKTMLIAG